jgi:hypothetical protein
VQAAQVARVRPEQPERVEPVPVRQAPTLQVVAQPGQLAPVEPVRAQQAPTLQVVAQPGQLAPVVPVQQAPVWVVLAR